MIQILSWANNLILDTLIETNTKYCETYFDIKGFWELCTSETKPGNNHSF